MLREAYATTAEMDCTLVGVDSLIGMLIEYWKETYAGHSCELLPLIACFLGANPV